MFQSLRGATAASLGYDLIAGLTLAAIAVPEQMATARLGGFGPQVGFFTFIAAALGFAAFGSSRRLSAGADSTITPIFAGSIVLLATVGSPHYVELAALLALMVGVLLVVAGLLKLGWIADLLSRPVITGFLAGVALHIALTQTPSVLGLPEGSGNVFQRLASLGAHAGAANPFSVGIGLGVLATIFVAEKVSARVPGALIALITATAATQTFHLDRRGVAVLGQVSAGLPQLRFPSIDAGNVVHLVGLAALVALVVMVQTGATTRSFSGDDADPDINRDYIGVGIGSFLAGLVGGIPVNASPPRTSVVAESGGESQFAGLFAALAVFILATFGAQLLAFIPIAALGGVLLFVAGRIFHAETFAQILRRAPAEFALALLTTVLIVILPIQTGVVVGVFLSLAYGVFAITRVRPVPFVRVPDTTVWWPASATQAGETQPGVLVMGFQAPLSFLNAYDFRRGMFEAIAHDKGAARLLVLEASSIVEIDFTAAMILSEVIAKAREAGLDFAIARLESVRAQAAFDRSTVAHDVGSDHIFRSVDEAIRVLASEGRRPSGRRP